MISSAYKNLKQILLIKQHTWLITGVAGFIGSNLLEALLQLKQRVIGVDNFVTGSKKNLDDVLSTLSKETQGLFTFFEGDICSFTDCQKMTAGVDYVLHQAALGSVPRSIKTPELTHATNSTGFLNILRAANEAKVKRFVYASSSSVYGDSLDLPKREEKVGNPLSPYAVSKYTNELYAKAFATCYGIETIGLRYFNVFGPRQDPNGAYAAVIPRWIKALINNEPVYINGDGQTSRDFCFVENAIQANLLAATTTHPQALNTVFNVAVGEQNNLKTLYDMMVSMLEQTKTPTLIYQDFRAGDIRHSLACIEKAKQLLGYMPERKLHEGLQKTISWFS